MKIRSGFVSNSSSSSFIITDSGLRTTAEVAWQMLTIILDRRSSYFDCEKYPESYKNGITALEFLNNNLEYNEPIIIPWSLNFETYIWKNSNNQICVDTCNNHSWCDEIIYSAVNEDWKWNDDINMDNWLKAEYLNLETMEKGIRNDWSAKYKRGEK